MSDPEIVRRSTASWRAETATGDGRAVEGRSPAPPSDGLDVPSSPRSRAGRNLPMAIVTGLVLAGVLISSLTVLPPIAFTTLIAGFCVVATLETAATLRTVGLRLAVPPVLAGSLVIVFGAHRSLHAGQAVGVLVLFAGTVAWLLADPERERVVQTLSTSLLFGLWAPFLASFGVLLATSGEDGGVAALLVAGSAIFGDIGGYAVGSLVGRTKIAPTVSPNKTLEGLVGGVLVAAAVAALVIPLLSDAFDVTTAAAVGAVCALAGFVGDLFESMVKRDLGVKDLGAFIPGHGGVMDRVDGILVALPVGFYVLMLLR